MTIQSSTKNLTYLLLIMLAHNVLTEEKLIEAQGRVLSKSDFPEVEKTENKSKLEVSKFFNTHLKKLIRFNQDKVIFSTGWQFGINTDNGRTSDFILGVNDKFLSSPDHHGSMEYQLVNIGENSVTIRYKSEFDHRSFGNNLISIDEGRFDVDYKE